MVPAKARHFTEVFLLTAGLLCLLMPVSAFLLSSAGFLLGLPLTPFHFPAVMLAVFTCTYLAVRSTAVQNIPAMLSGLAVFIALSVWGMIHLNLVFDNSYDGIWYHQEAVINLYRGWNPVYGFPDLLPGKSEGPFYAYHYPKAPWIAGAVVYRFTSALESAKVVTLWLVAAQGLLAAYLLPKRTKLPAYAIMLLSLLVFLNPVAIYQLYSFYVDAQLGAAATLLILLLLLDLSGNERVFAWLAAAAMIYLANTKFTGLVYAVILVCGYLLYVFFCNRKAFVRKLILNGLAGCSAVLIFGYAPYVTNTLSKGHPLYPIMGPGSFGDVISAIPRSADFNDRNRFEKYWLATFAKPVYCRAPLKSTPKKLFSALPDYSYFARADFEVSGFGPWYAECWILLAGGMVLLLVLKIPGKREALILLGLVLASSFVNSEAWYARYVPQLWLSGPIIVYALLRHRYARYWGMLTGIALLLNVALLGTICFSQRISQAVGAHREIETLKKLQRPPRIFLGFQVTFDVKAKELGLTYQAMNDSLVDLSEYRTFNGFPPGFWAMYHAGDMEEAGKQAGNGARKD